MKLCILDPALHIPGLKLLFPEGEYYGHEPDNFFKYISTKHYTREQILNDYGYTYRIDWETINDKNYDYLFISAPLADYYHTISNELETYTNRMKIKIKEIINNNNFKKVILFDTYDYDYDPSIINTDWKVDYYFKRNYNNKIKYNNNVFPFPYIMFVKPCVLTMIINKKNIKNNYKYNRALWCGNLYNHIDNKNNIQRMRLEMYNKISNKIDNGKFTESEFINKIREYKIVVDLMGVGDPNKRTIEILTNGTLMLSMCYDLNWGFDDNENFHPDTYFKTAEEFSIKLDKLINDEEHYKKCLEHQEYIINKYFNKRWLREYIEKKINYEIKDTVCLFITSCNRPKLLNKTLESFMKYNKYPIEYGIILEDSGLKGINDFANKIVNFPLIIVYADKRRGQMKSIENGTPLINTKYIFHCEEDWEFYNSGFIEESIKILKLNNMITGVRLRSHDELINRYKYGLIKKDDYYIVTGYNTSFSFNPGLKTYEIHNMFMPYEYRNNKIICEGVLAENFEKIGMITVTTNNIMGYVKHIGWNDHVY